MAEDNQDAVSLDSLLVPEKTIELEFPGFDGLTFKVCYLSRDELIKLRKVCVSTKFNRRSRQPEDVLDEDKFLEEYTKRVVKGWSGFKYKYLEEFLLADISNLDPQMCMPYNEANAKSLMKQSAIFDDWLTDVVSDLNAFTTAS